MILAATPTAQNPVLSDDFNDGVLDPVWTPIFDPLQFWNVYEGNGFWNFESLTTPFGAFQEQFILEAGLAQPLGAFELDFRLVWEEHPSLPPGSGVTLTHIVLLDSGMSEIARIGYEDTNVSGGGDIVFRSANGSASLPQAAAGDARFLVSRDAAGNLNFSTAGSGGASSGSFGTTLAGVAFLRIQTEHSSACGPCGPFMEPTRFDWIEFGPPGGPSLSLTGTCPGAASISVSGATPNGKVIFLYGLAGATQLGSGPCAGLTLGMSQPQVGLIAAADGTGKVTRAVQLPAGACGLIIQAVDRATCAATGTLVL